MLGIIINPKSGKKAFRAQRIYLWKLLRKRHQPFAYRVTKYAGHAIELARELVEKGYDEILILGGDGTLSEAINGIMRSTLTPEQRAKIQVGLMPRGTGNDWDSSKAKDIPSTSAVSPIGAIISSITAISSIRSDSE